MSSIVSDRREAAASPKARAARGLRFQLGIVLGLLVMAAAVAVAGFTLWNLPERCFQRARLALQRGDIPTVEREIERLGGKPTHAPHRRFLLGAVLLKQGKPNEAIGELEFAVNHPDLQLESMVLLGQALYESGRAGNAQMMWNRALAIDSTAVDAHRWLGVMYYDLGAMEQSLQHLTKVAELDQRDGRPSRLMGLINKDYERPDEAVKHYREALRREPNSSERNAILLELATCQIKLFDYPAALKTLEECEPTSQQATLCAEAHLSSGEKEEAATFLAKALESDPRNKDALLLKGRMELEGGRLDESVAALTQAVEFYPKDYVTRFKLVQALRRQGNEAEAAKHEAVANELKDVWRRFSDLHMKALQEATNSEARFELGELALKLDRADLAKSWFQAVLAIDPGNQRAIDHLKQIEEK